MAAFDILILAAGEGKRMTGIKQLLPIGKSTFIELVIQKAINLEPRHIVVVLGAHQDKIIPVIKKYPITKVENPHWKSGMGGSLATGVNFIADQYGNAEGLLILLCDQLPIIQDKTFLEQMLAQWKNNPLQIVATSWGKKLGVPALFPANFTSHLKDLKGDKGARDLLNSGLNTIVGINSRNLGLDIDTDEEYQQFLAANR